MGHRGRATAAPSPDRPDYGIALTGSAVRISEFRAARARRLDTPDAHADARKNSSPALFPSFGVEKFILPKHII